MPPSTPKLDVTFLGPSDSGKTTFLMGMYATLCAGSPAGWTLQCTDYELGLQLLNRWDEFVEKGKLPDPNPDGVTHLYPFLFKSGIEPWLKFDILDYRGGLINNPGDTRSDLHELHNHLRHAASVYITISSEHLTAPVTSGTLDQVLRRTRLRYIGGLLQTAIEECQSAGRRLPSVVVLLTKSDHLRPRFEGRTQQVVLKELIDDVEQLLPILFAKGMTTMICPVRIGRLVDGWQPDSLDPRNLKRPVAFTLLHHIQAEAEAGKMRITNAIAERTEAAQAHAELRSRLFGGLFHRSRLAELRSAVTDADHFVAGESALQTVREEQIDRLFELVGNAPILQDGVITNVDLEEEDDE